MTFRFLSGAVAVVGAAGFAGVMLAIGLILGAYWKSLPPEIFMDWFSANNHLVARVIPLTAGPAFIAMAASLWLNWSNGSARLYWMIALGAFVLIFVITAAFHLPANAAFAAKSISPAAATAKLDLWLNLHYARIALGFISAFAAVAALTH